MTEAKGERKDGLTEIAVQPPPNLAELINYPGAARYLALYYAGTNATWDDGLASATFSYFAVYSPMIEHPVLAQHLLDADLGSDDGPPTHALVCDREGGKFLVGRYEDAMRLVHGQFSEDDRRAAGERYAALFEGLATLEGMRARGMFEFLVAPSEAAQLETEGLLRHFDAQITPEVVGRYVELSKGGDHWRVFGQLSYLQALLKRAREAGGGRGRGVTPAGGA